jgi:hypothetical protein
MPYEIVTTSGLAHFRLHGSLTVTDIRAVLAELDALDGHHQTTLNRLIDISDVTNVSVDFKGVHDVAETRAAVRLHNETKTAIVAPSMLQYGCARMFEMLNQQKQTKVAVFRDHASASSWLNGQGAAEDGTV